jgi:hypothetical protein
MPSSTPIYALPYPLNTDLVRVAPTDLQNLATNIEQIIDAKSGLKVIVPTGPHTNISFDSKGVGTPTVGTGTFTIGGAFTTTYDVYRIVWNGGGSNVDTGIRCTYPGLTSAYYGNLLYTRANNTTVVSGNDNNNVRHTWCGWAGSGITVDVQVVTPFQSTHRTYIQAQYMEINIGAGSALGTYTGFNSSPVSVTGITFELTSGVVVSSGEVRIYAYNR